MPEFTPYVETLRVDVNELACVSDVAPFLEARVQEAKQRLRSNNGIDPKNRLAFSVGAWRRVGTNMECDVTLLSTPLPGTIAQFHERMKGTP